MKRGNFKILVVGLSSLFFACENNLIYFDLDAQKIIRCKSLGIRQLSIDNDSLKTYYHLEWVGITEAPKELSLNKIDSGYKITINGVKTVPINSFKLIPDAFYTITHSSNGDGGPNEMQIFVTRNRVSKASKISCY